MTGTLELLKQQKEKLCQQLEAKYPLGGHYHSTSMLGCKCDKDKLNDKIWEVNRQINKLTMSEAKYKSVYEADRITRDGINWGSALEEHLRNNE